MAIIHIPEHEELIRSRAYISGQWVTSTTGTVFDVIDPATGDVVAEVANVGARETLDAISAAKEAMSKWKDETAKSRAAVLKRWFDLIVANVDGLAALMVREQGKPFAEAQGEVLFGASYVEWYAEEAKRAYGEIIPSYSPDRRLMVVRQPIGVVAAITPWNFPSAMVTRKCAPAIAAGCTVVLKPAEQTPLCALALAHLAEKAGMPPGVFNVIPTNTPAAVGEALTSSPDVAMLTFTGSTEIGKALMKKSAQSVKKVTLELGGHAPFIVFDDADLDAAVAGAMASKFRTSGQTCVCANRILVQEGVEKEFTDKFTSAVENLRVGSGFEEGVDQGPLIDAQAVEKVRKHIDDAVRNGAQVLLGGSSDGRGGTFFQPTVLNKVQENMLVAREETFGPVAPLMTFSTEDDAIKMANNTRYGLAAYAFTKDLNRAIRLAEGIEAGSVGINTGAMSSEAVPAGGMKESGIGREGSKHGLDDFLEIKQICIAGI